MAIRSRPVQTCRGFFVHAVTASTFCCSHTFWGGQCRQSLTQACTSFPNHSLIPANRVRGSCWMFPYFARWPFASASRLQHLMLFNKRSAGSCPMIEGGSPEKHFYQALVQRCYHCQPASPVGRRGQRAGQSENLRARLAIHLLAYCSPRKNHADGHLLRGRRKTQTGRDLAACQQILGNCSPDSMVTMRSPPMPIARPPCRDGRQQPCRLSTHYVPADVFASPQQAARHPRRALRQ